jgi:hypothetical protein
MLRSKDRNSDSLSAPIPRVRPTSLTSLSLASSFYQCNRSNYISDEIHLFHGVDFSPFEAAVCVSLVLVG